MQYFKYTKLFFQIFFVEIQYLIDKHNIICFIKFYSILILNSELS